MRIAFISTMQGIAWGGSEELWFETAKEAVKHGHAVAASIGHWGISSSKLKTLRNLGVEIYFQPVSRRNIAKSDVAGRLVSKLKQVAGGEGYIFKPISEFKPDIICINQANTHDIPRFPHLRDFLLKEKIPYTVICHGHEDVPLPNDEARQMSKAHFSDAVWVGFVAKALINSIERHLAASVNNGFVIRNPVNLTDTSEVMFPSMDKNICFANVARVESYQKGQDVLFEALATGKWRNRDWQLSLAGEGPHLNYLHKLAKHYNIENKIRFLGQVTDVRRLWSEHHLLLLPSRYEGTPLSLIEAMLCGRPAVVTDVAGHCEWIENEVNGFVAEAPTSIYLQQALERAWEKRSQWKAMGMIARQTALSQYPQNPGLVLLDLLTEPKRAESLYQKN